MGTAHADSPAPRWHQLVSDADRDALGAALGDQALAEVGAFLCNCDELLRVQVVRAVLQAAPEFPDSALLAALARVAHMNSPGVGAEASETAT